MAKKQVLIEFSWRGHKIKHFVDKDTSLNLHIAEVGVIDE